LAWPGIPAEEDARRWAAYERVKVERDKLAAELAELYPAIEGKLAELLERIDANDRQIEHINDRALPSGARRLVVAELVARGLPSFTPKPYVDAPRITKELRLPTFAYPGERYAWPRSR
jgi:hypothetical protein